MKNTNRIGLVVLAFVALTVGSARAVDHTWWTDGSGFWGDSMNWNPATVPAEADYVYFKTNISASTYVVTLTNAVSINRLRADINSPGHVDVILDLNGNNFTVTNATATTMSTQLGFYSWTDFVFTNSSATPAIFEGQRINFGNSSTNANLVVSGSNLVMHFSATGTDEQFFYTGSGSVRFEKGAIVTMSNSLQFARLGTQPGRLTMITDPGTKLTIYGSQFHIAKAGQGMPTVVVSNGASVLVAGSANTYIGNGEDAGTGSPDIGGKLIATGSGTKFDTFCLFMGDSAGNAGKTSGGYLEVMDGAAFTVTNYVRMGYGATTTPNTNAYGSIIVSNANSRMDVRGSYMQVGWKGYGDVVVADNAQLTVTNNSGAYILLAPRSTLTVSDAEVRTKDLNISNATVRLELGARDHASAYINLSGALHIYDPADALEIVFLDDFDYSGLGIGDKISLIKYGSVSGDFAGWTDFVTTVSSGGYEFLYNKIGGEIYLDVNAIPEPGTFGLIGAGLGLVALIRRRRG